jgi:hypothetical protein
MNHNQRWRHKVDFCQTMQRIMLVSIPKIPYGPKTRPDLSATLVGQILGTMDGLQ